MGRNQVDPHNLLWNHVKILQTNFFYQFYLGSAQLNPIIYLLWYAFLPISLDCIGVACLVANRLLPDQFTVLVSVGTKITRICSVAWGLSDATLISDHLYSTVYNRVGIITSQTLVEIITSQTLVEISTIRKCTETLIGIFITFSVRYICVRLKWPICIIWGMDV